MNFKQAINAFIIHLPKTHKNTIMCGDIELYLDSRFNPVEHRIPKGKVVAVPRKTNTGVKVGDYIYFHHHVINQNLCKVGGDYYAVFDKELDPMCYARQSEIESFTPIYDYMFLEPLPPSTKEERAGLTILKKDKDREGDVREGIVKYASDKAIEHFKTYNVDIVGRKVNFRRFRNYKVDINGEKLYRMKARDINFVYDV